MTILNQLMSYLTCLWNVVVGLNFAYNYNVLAGFDRKGGVREGGRGREQKRERESK